MKEVVANPGVVAALPVSTWLPRLRWPDRRGKRSPPERKKQKKTETGEPVTTPWFNTVVVLKCCFLQTLLFRNGRDPFFLGCMVVGGGSCCHWKLDRTNATSCSFMIAKRNKTFFWSPLLIYILVTCTPPARRLGARHTHGALDTLLKALLFRLLLFIAEKIKLHSTLTSEIFSF